CAGIMEVWRWQNQTATARGRQNRRAQIEVGGLLEVVLVYYILVFGHAAVRLGSVRVCVRVDRAAADLKQLDEWRPTVECALRPHRIRAGSKGCVADLDRHIHAE